MSTADRRTAVGLFFLTFVAYASFFGGAGWNQNANFDLTRAIVERGTIAIDAYAGNTGDVSRYGGHVYSNKAPGLSLLAVPAYAVIRAFIDEDDPFGLIIALWLCTVAVCATSGALLVAAIYVYGRTRMGASQGASLAVALLIAFGTYIFSWSTVFFMHVPSALLLFLAFLWARERPLAAGLCAGAAGLCNYLCIPAALILLLYAGRRNALRFLAGGAPFALALLAYQAAAFGSPFTTSIAYTRESFLERGATLGVLSLPRLDVLFEILIGRYRGLFFLSPILAVAFAGAVILIRRRAMRTELITIAALVAYFVLTNAAFNYWDGGSALGPRHILPIVPLLAVPMLAATALWRPLWIVLGAISIAVNLVATAVNPLPSRIIRDPVGSYLFPLFLTGRLPASIPPEPLWSWKVMLGHVSVSTHAPDEAYPYTRHRPGSAVAQWASFNVGEVAFPGRASVVPVVVWIVVGSGVLARMKAEGRRQNDE